MFKRIRGERGFTLVELLVVLAILAILVAVVVPNLTGLLTSAEERAMKHEREVVQNAIDTYYTQDHKVDDLGEITGATAYATLAYIDDDSAAYFTKYLRRATEYYYSWTTHGKDLSVCDSTGATCFP